MRLFFLSTFASSISGNAVGARSQTYCYNDPTGRPVVISLIKQTKTMETKILKVVRRGEAFSVQSAKADGGQIQKCNIVLKELGGKFENEYVCAMLGNLAACRFYEGDVVVATLRFSTHEYPGQTFQEILATDIVKVN